MHKTYRLITTVLILCLLCSCSNAELSSASVQPSIDSSGSSSQPSASIVPGDPAQASPSQAIVVDNKARGEFFRTFLSDNYQKLSDAFFGGISGIAFIDLDMDGGIEMLIFDAGASAAMGLQFFDIVDDNVECVSANMEAVGTSFGGEHLSDVIVNANTFEDFRLMQDKATDEKFFIVESGNGAADFSYTELIRFGNDNGVPTLQSLVYKHEDYNIDSGDLTGESFKLSGKAANRSVYEAAYSKFFAGVTDTGYVAKGVLLWENTDYEDSLDGLLAMADKALTLYKIPKNS